MARKRAWTDVLCLIRMAQLVAVQRQAPVQPAKLQPGRSARAVNVTVAPTAKGMTQILVHVIPYGLTRMVPVPPVLRVSVAVAAGASVYRIPAIARCHRPSK